MQSIDKAKLGIFVTAGIGIFIAALFVIGNRQNIFDSTFEVSTQFPTVGGLQKGNNIWFAGVKVGTVGEVSIASDTVIQVKLNVLTSVRSFIKKDTKAAISSEGVLGNKIITLSAGSSGAGVVEDGDVLSSDASMDTDAMLATLEKTNENIAVITDNVKLLSARITAGEGSLGELLADTVMVTKLNQTLASLEQSGTYTAQTTRNLAKLSAGIEAGDGLVGALLKDPSYERRVDSTLTSLSATGDQVAKAAGELNAITDDVSRLLKAAQSPDAPLGVLLQDPEFADDLQRSMENVRLGTAELETTLEAAQKSFLMRKRIFRRNKEDRGKKDKE